MFCILSLSNCKKDIIDNSSSVKLQFSRDSILFDTVFTTLGSVTKQLMVYNTEKKKIKISSIRLGGGNNSLFSININGTYTTSASDIEIEPKDSLYIFIKVTVNPNNQNNPLVVSDSLLFNTNGNEQKVKLVAWGQDAYFHVANKYIKGLPPYIIIAKEHENKSWETDKPHVVYGFAVVDSTGSLTIPAGTKVYFYNNSGMWVYKGGSLKVNGTKEKPVIFQGTRLDTLYKNVPGQWDRIWLNEGSVNNEINYAIIKNAFVGIQAETFNKQMGNQLILTNTIIKNCSGFGLLARDYIINAANCLITNCGQYGIALTRGGSYDFRNCTLGNYWSNEIRQTPSVVLNNYIANNNGDIIAVKNLDKAYFGNCILYGNIEEELLLDSTKTGVFNYTFDHCLLRTKLNTKNHNYINILKNVDPVFKSTDSKKGDYHLKDKDPASPAIGTGSADILNNTLLSTILHLDIESNPRPSGSSTVDIGVYQPIK